MLDVIVECCLESFSILVLGEHHCASVEDKPTYDQGQISNDEDFFGVYLMPLVNISII